MQTYSVESLPRPIGYVLGGGGSLGAVQVGMLQALSERDVQPDLVAGTSVGSINGAVLASDPLGAANRLSHVWARLTRAKVFPGNLIAQALLLQRAKTHLFPNTGLADMIVDFLGSTTDFEHLRVPFAAVTMDVATAQPHVIRHGPLLPALLASSAIPGIYPPVDYDGLHLYDGGVVANVPMRQAVDMGARSLIVLDCFFPGQLPGSTDTLADILLYTALVTMRSQAVAEATLVAESLPVVYLPGPTPKLVSPLDFTHTTDLIADAYTSARRFLEDVRITGPGLYHQAPPGGGALA
ncbi:patatin-like phospholipase family protein [Mycolicibacterium sp. CH28]|uniref:patatin-like phospholipase family protein n=1 Tax=Mycolicibacterium sp. CH28 TaxID=2512237 RepID=UPI001F2B5FD2|nr:patatin-like phospholipase family protein [Mycolicibacterium sp. CH28]